MSTKGNGKGERFIQAAVLEDTNECILWPFAITKQGYGLMSLNGELVYAHRRAATVAHGPSPSDAHDAAHAPVICHSRACVNKRHVRWATRAENVADQILDGTTHNGEKNGQAKLIESDVYFIRNSSSALAAIADFFGVTIENIRAIRSGRSWKHTLPVSTNVRIVE